MRFPPSRYCDIYFLEDHYKQKCCHFERAGGGIARSGEEKSYTPCIPMNLS